MEEKTRQFGPNLGVVPVTGSSISRFMRSWLRLTFLCLASIIKYPISSFVSKSTHVGIMQMNQRLDRSQNPSILIKLPIFTEEYLICIGLNWIWLHKDPQCVVDGLEENLTIIQMSLFHSNKRCLFRVQWTLTKVLRLTAQCTKTKSAPNSNSSGHSLSP